MRISFVIFLLFSCFFYPSTLVMAEEALSWHTCVKEAAKNHPDLISAEEGIKQSEATKKVTASALFPQVNSNLDVSTGRTDNGTVSAAGDNYTYGVTGSQLIFDGAKTINNVNAAKENIKAAKENFRFTSVDVRLRLRKAFVNLLKAQEGVHIAKDIYKIRSKNLALIMLRYRSGLEHKGALLTAEANLSKAKLEIAIANRDVIVSQRQLAKEMGEIGSTSLAVNGDFEVKESVAQKPDFEILAKNNPSFQQLAAQVNSADFGVKAAYANFAPTLSGSASANKNDSRWAPHDDQWNLGLSVSMPVFEGGLRIAQVEQAKAALNQLKANEKSTRDGLIFTLEQTWALLQDAIENVKVQKEILFATEERSKIAQAQYSIGFMTFDNWTIIEDNLVSAKNTYLSAQAAALLAEANWIQAKGETLEYD
ncbi:MAG: TolC family protein [Candidatus Omnitrophica bacterium]|jgi:outer membrane protein TolC|nr:TolC family protein [Candidatus Omnitrophota bacterium]